MAKRYKLTTAEWDCIAPLLPGKVSNAGRRPSITALCGRYCGFCVREPIGAALPERYGKWKRLHKRFSRWAKAGVREVFEALVDDPGNEYLMLDTLWFALGRSDTDPRLCC
jgi:transposase